MTSVGCGSLGGSMELETLGFCGSAAAVEEGGGG